MKTCNELSSPLELAVLNALAQVIDPEIGENIVDLGLVYAVAAEGNSVSVNLTMTSPACPLGEMVLDDVRAELASAIPDADIDVRLVWEPPWNPDMMSAIAKEHLGWD